MKSEKGITLTSLIVYIFAMSMIVSIITVITGYFYSNFDIIESKEDFNFKYTKVISYFAKEINLSDNEIVSLTTINEDELESKQIRILFSSGNQYTYIPKNKSIYLGTYKICDGIDDVEWIFTEDDSKQNVELIITQGDLSEKVKYTLVKN